MKPRTKRLDNPNYFIEYLKSLHNFVADILAGEKRAYEMAVDEYKWDYAYGNRYGWNPSRSKLSVIVLQEGIKRLKTEVTL